MADRPNILFLMSDEHRADVTGYEGNPVVRTPVLDELARTGVVFRNAYTPSPICIPGRQAMMSGQFPRTCHCEVYGEDLAPNSMTFARRLAQHAYKTVASGKLHHMGPDQMQGWTTRLSGDIDLDNRYVEGRCEADFARYTRTLGGIKWSDSKEILRAGIGRSPYIAKDEMAVDGAIQFIEDYFLDPYYDRAEPNRPLMLKVSLNQPHYPYFTSAEKFNYYLNRVPLFLAETVSPHPFLSQRQVRPGVDASERDLRRAVAAYYGMVETLDEQYGRVMEALARAGQDLDDWIIIYTTDHGEMLGQHGIWEKQKFYEASARVPLIIRWPRRFRGGRVVTQNVNLCDLFATLCDLTVVPVPAGLDSRSLVPLMEGQTTGWGDETVSQFGRTNLMIKWGSLKYQYYGPAMPEVLFDLSKDPTETVDFVADPSYSEVLARFRVRCGGLGFGPNADPAYAGAGYSS